MTGRAVAAETVQFESLESRHLLAAAWGPFPHLIDQDAASEKYPTITGRGESIAVLDSGVNYNDPLLGGSLGRRRSKVIAGWDFTTNTANPMDDYGHGTAVAGLLAANPYTYRGDLYQGIAPGVRIIALRVYSGKPGFVRNAKLYERALRWVIANRRRYNIVGVNLTYFVGSGFFNAPRTGPPFGDELATLSSRGVFIAGPDGNLPARGGQIGVDYPAADPNLFAVGGSTVRDTMYVRGRRGPLTDILAPADGVVTPFYNPTSHSAEIIVGEGTSLAAPFVTGTAALIKQINPAFTPAQIMSILQDSGVPIYDSFSHRTYKRLDVLAALDLAYARSHRARPAAVLSGTMSMGAGVTASKANLGQTATGWIFSTADAPIGTAQSALTDDLARVVPL